MEDRFDYYAQDTAGNVWCFGEDVTNYRYDDAGNLIGAKKIAAVRAGSVRTVRERARSIYSKAGLTGRSALSAFFLEDLIAPSRAWTKYNRPPAI